MENSARVSVQDDASKFVWGIAVVLQAPCLFWAFGLVSEGFRDSEGYPRNRSFGGHFDVYWPALLPLLLLTLATWLARPRRSNFFWLLAVMPSFIVALSVLGAGGDGPADVLRVAGPFAVYALLVFWLQRLNRVI